MRALIGTIATVAVLASACGGAATATKTPSPVEVRPSATTSGAQTTYPTPTLIAKASPSPTRQASELADGGTVFSGTYHTRFEPDLTLTIDNVVDLDCSPGYHCRGDISANLPNWLDLEFGNVHGSEFMVFRIDPVADPNAPNELIDPPADFAGWISMLPGIEVLEPPKPVTVGGIDATQLDVVSPVDAGFGPTGLAGPDEPAWFGLAANHETRAIVLAVDGQTVLITEQIGVENTTGDFEAVVSGLQPLLDSIVWR